MKNQNNIQSQYVVNSYVNRQLTLVKGSKQYLFDEYGQKYLDLMTNYGVNIFGYNNSSIIRSLKGQLKKLSTLHGSFTNDTRASASEELILKCGSEYSQVFWSSSGSEAIEAALKFAVLATKKQKFIVCNQGFHGKTLGALSATSNDKYKKPFFPLLWKFVTIPFNDTDALEQTIDGEVAGFIVEPIQGEGGINVPAQDYLNRVRKTCTDKKILLIIDEVQTGVGRTGHFLKSQERGVSADILCLGKGLGAGVPIGATLVSQFVASHIPKHIHTSTFGGNPLACAGAGATMGLLNEACLEYVRSIGKYFANELNTLKSRHVIEVRGEGLMLGLVVSDKRDQLLKLLQKNYILAIGSGENVVRFLPSYLITKNDVRQVVRVINKILENLD